MGGGREETLNLSADQVLTKKKKNLKKETYQPSAERGPFAGVGNKGEKKIKGGIYHCPKECLGAPFWNADVKRNMEKNCKRESITVRRVPGCLRGTVTVGACKKALDKEIPGNANRAMEKKRSDPKGGLCRPKKRLSIRKGSKTDVDQKKLPGGAKSLYAY